MILTVVRPVKFLLPVALMVMNLSSAAFAQPDDEDVDTPGLTVDALAGWKGMASVSAPVPISFLLSNFTNGPIEGELVLIDDWGGHKVSLGDIYLTAGQTRRLSTVQAMRQWNRCLAELRNGNQVLWRRQLTLNNGTNYNRTSNHVLIINDSQRMLEFPGPEQPASPDVSGVPPGGVVVNQATPSLVSMNAMTWQMPTHPGPLVPITAIVFPGPLAADRLNAGQWQALGRYVAAGGTVFLPADEEKLRDALSAASPFGLQPDADRDGLSVYRCGLGSVRTFRSGLFVENSSALDAQLAAVLERLPHEELHRQIALSSAYSRDSGRAERSRISILTFMTIYTLLSGIVTLTFMKRKKRTVLIYVCSLVGIACLTSVILGSSVRYSRGDVSWVSVTRLTENGGLQYAELEVQSAGGRSDRLSVTGRQPDLQVVASESQRYYGNNWFDSDPHPAFTVQTTQAPDRGQAFEARVPITPWGRRDLIATDYLPDLQPLEVDLKFEQGAAAGDNTPAVGQFAVTVKNTSGLELTDCRICVSVGAGEKIVELVEQTRLKRVRRYGYWQEEAAIPTRYSAVVLGDLTKGATKTARFQSDPNQTRWTLNIDEGRFNAPSATATAGIRAWLVARIAQSPSMQIDEDNSNFGAVTSAHFIAQELTPDQIPENLKRVSGQMIHVDTDEF